jgi:1,4-dihydroxy-2-naphthoate polyprenyltransferase
MMLLHAGANIFNDFYDYRKGVDRPGTFGSSGVLVEKLMSSRALFTEGVIVYAVAVGIGVYLWVSCGPWVFWLGLIGASMGFFYTTIIPLKYYALGDVAVFSAFGILITLGAYYVQTSSLSWIPALYAIPFGLLIDAILHGNNLRDIRSDAVVNVTTLAGHMGVRGSQIYYLVIVAAAFLTIPVLIVADHLPWTALLVFLSIPIAVRNIRAAFQSETLPREKFAMIDAMGAQLQMAFGVLLTIGVVLGRLV